MATTSDNTALLANNSNSNSVTDSKAKYLFISLLVTITIISVFIACVSLLGLIIEQTKNASKFAPNIMCQIDSAPNAMNKVELLSDEYQAKMHQEIRANFVTELRKNSTLANAALIYMRGVQQEEQRQERNFLYLSGVFWYGYDLIVDVATGKTILLAPHIPQREAIWNLPYIPTLEQVKEKFGVDQVLYTDNRTSIVKQLNKNILLVTEALPAGYLGDATFDYVDTVTLGSIFTTIRAVKTFRELQVMRYANQVSSNAHIALMKSVKPKLWEYQLEALFLFETDKCSLRKQAYEPICGSGTNSAVLHYINNDKQIKDAMIIPPQIVPEDIILVDAGAEFIGYASDITRTYPSTGKFTPEQAGVYNAVLKTQETAIQACKNLVPWNNITAIASTTMLSELQTLEFVAKDVPIERLLAAGIHKLFQPHGLGHLVGLDVHDTSVYPQNLLLTNMVVTIEPGIYFIPFLFEQATPEQQPFLNMNKIRQFYKFGGVRIEDDILITDSGNENLTLVPKMIEDIERIMA